MTDSQEPQELLDSDASEVKKEAAHRSESRHALIQLVLIVLAALMASLITGVTKVVLVVLAIVIMVMVHEFGHYITAKWSGMKVTEFFLGFGPRVWSFRKGETEYGIRAIPAGGFVKVIGMNNLDPVDPKDEHRAFRSSPVWRRVVMASAGSFMHFVMAFLLSFSLLAFVGKPQPTTTLGPILQLKTQSPAQDAGLRAGDKLVSINSQPVTTWKNATDILSTALPGQPVPISVERANQTLNLSITPVDRRSVIQADGTSVVQTDPNVAKGFVGIQPTRGYQTIGFVPAATESLKTLGRGTIAVFEAFGRVFSPSGLKLYYQNVTGTVPEGKQAEADQNRFISPVGLVDVSRDAAESGWFAVLSLLFSINLFIGIFNMVPLLPFDGGHVAVAIYEKIRSIGRRATYHADYAKLVPVSYAVLLVLVLISASSLYLDISNPLPNQFK